MTRSLNSSEGPSPGCGRNILASQRIFTHIVSEINHGLTNGLTGGRNRIDNTASKNVNDNTKAFQIDEVTKNSSYLYNDPYRCFWAVIAAFWDVGLNFSIRD